MKILKYCFFGIISLVVVFMIAINVNLSFKNQKLNDLLLINVEALAQGEGGGFGDCFGDGNVTCNGGKYYVRYSR